MKTILLIESSSANLIALAMILRSLGYGVLEAGNQDEAWFACHQHRGTIHLLLTRAVVENPGTDDFVARLLLVHPRLRVLFLCESVPAVLDDMPCEFAFLKKPFQVETLACTIEALLEGPRKRVATSLS